MNFARSTQRKSWIFSQESIDACREKAVAGSPASSSSGGSSPRAQKFASGFHSRQVDSPSPIPTEIQQPLLSVRNQETLVQFHAHQIQTLVGPYALLPELRRSQKVLSTAIILFRRFFLSNSVVDFNPRKIATAAAFFGAKIEEEKIEISILSHATALVHRKVRHAPLCRTELESVSMPQIEEGERELMEGVNYEFICHHPDDMMEDLLADIIDFMGEQRHLSLSSMDFREPCETRNCDSPRGVELTGYDYPDDMMENVMDAVNQTLIFSDAPFLFSPEAIAYAINCIETGSFHQDGHMGDDMQSYLITRHPFKSEEEILDFSREVGNAIACLLESPDLDLVPGKRRSNVIAQRAEDLRRVLIKVADLRLFHQMSTQVDDMRSGSRKRRRMYGYTPGYRPTEASAATGKQRVHYRKMVKVTPTTNNNTGYVC